MIRLPPELPRNGWPAPVLRPDAPTLALAELVYRQGERHITAESLHAEATRAAVPVSLATVYNTLCRFTDCGLLREVAGRSGQGVFRHQRCRPPSFLLRSHRELVDIPLTM